MSRVPTETQVSAGGVAFRRRGALTEIALISVGAARRWQLPKGLVGAGEAHERAALREVREEAGVECESLGLIDVAEYWYVAQGRGGRRRFHKFVHFYLLRYVSGDVHDHDHEVNEARWVEINGARDLLAFAGEREIVRRAQEMLHYIEEAARPA